MNSVEFVETDDCWDIRVPGAQVTRVSFDWAVTLLVASGDSFVEVRIENKLSITDANGFAVLVDPEGELAQLAGALRLLRSQVTEMRAFKSGMLEIMFEGETIVRVAADPDAESWQASTSDGIIAVSSPGGDLAIWRR